MLGGAGPDRVEDRTGLGDVGDAAAADPHQGVESGPVGLRRARRQRLIGGDEQGVEAPAAIGQGPGLPVGGRADTVAVGDQHHVGRDHVGLREVRRASASPRSGWLPRSGTVSASRANRVVPKLSRSVVGEAAR
ncbi:hypothetical protein MBRA_02345 [Methylobacterium brachiatum]|nr:hypothetical protein MBRA_02345 [Methylobacterium brachiatum]